MYTKGILFCGISPNKMQGALKCEMLVEWAFCYIKKNYTNFFSTCALHEITP
jgi:hypothetical protein